jgi:methyl-accepting chemotaxis protein
MNWYKNAKTSTKLLLAFGILAALLGGVGYQGIVAAAKLNDSLATLYNAHLLGMAYVDDAKAAVPMIGRELRQSLLVSDVAQRQQCTQKVQEYFGTLEEALAGAEKKLVSAAGKAELVKIQHWEPQYRQLVLEIVHLAEARQDKEAIEKIAKAKVLGDELAESCDRLGDMKQALGKQAFEESSALYYSMRTTLIAVSSGSVILALIMGILIARLISRPLGQAAEVLRAVGDRDLTRTLAIDTRDEIGEMARALNRACDGVRHAMSDVRDSSGGVATAAEQLAAAAEQLSSGTQEQASSQEETSSSLQELSTAVRQNADNARQASQLASSAREAADNGGTVVHSAVAAMAEINTASKRIADIITAIDEIAFQTNLLALNAAVEAARAGEQGRGFAVVASEVRSLAQRSATAAKEIKALIQDSVRKVDAGSELVNRSGRTLTEIVSSVKRVTDIVGEIAAASHQQAVGIEQVTKAMAQMDQVTQTNAAQTEELSSTSQTLATHAAQMQDLVGRFVLDTDSPREAIATKSDGKPSSRRDVSARQSLAKLSSRVSHSSPEAAVFEEF